MIKISYIHLLLCIGLISCVDESLIESLTPPKETLETLEKTDNHLRFVAIGDMGTGDQYQQWVADAIEQVCEENTCDFAIGLGDNIYEAGVTGVNDEQFFTKFERPYRHLDFPFYMALGNHDNSYTALGAGINNIRGEIQVEYTWNPNRPSNKWNMPARYYDFSMPDNETPLIDFFAMDSNPIGGGLDASQAYWRAPYTKAHQEWLTNKLATSSAPWRIAFAHHPYISNGKHGNAGWYDGIWLLGNEYKLFLESTICDKVDLLVTGHDHDLQWLEAKPACGKTEFVISGAGGKTRSLKDTHKNSAFFQEGDVLGFVIFTVSETSLTGDVYRVSIEDGTVDLAFSRSLSK